MSDSDYSAMERRIQKALDQRVADLKLQESLRTDIHYNILLPITPEQVDAVLKIIEKNNR